MTDSSASSPPPRRLLTRAQVLAALRREREDTGLSATARRYGISPQQLWNVLEQSAPMSKRMLRKCKYRVWEFLERVEGGEGEARQGEQEGQQEG